MGFHKMTKRASLLMVTTAALITLLACSFLPFGGSLDPTGSDASNEPQTVEAEINRNEGGTLEHPGGAQLSFEPGSLDQDATVSLTSLGFEQPSASSATPLLSISQSFQIDLGGASLADGEGARLSLQLPTSEQLEIPASHVALSHADANGYLRLRSVDYNPETNSISQSLSVLNTPPSALSRTASIPGLAKPRHPSEQTGALDETLAIAYLPPTGSYDLPGQIGPLQVPYYWQSSLAWCTPTALSMLFNYHGNPYGITENWTLAAGIGLDRDTGGTPNYTALNNLGLPRSEYEFLWWDGSLIDWPQPSSGSDGAVLYRNTLYTSYLKWQLSGMDLREMVGPELHLEFGTYSVTIPTPDIRFGPRPVQVTSDAANHAFVVVGASEDSIWTHDSSGAVGDRRPAAEMSLEDFKDQVFVDTDNRELRSVVYHGGARPEAQRRGSIVLGLQQKSENAKEESSAIYHSPGANSNTSYWRWDGDENDNGYIWDDPDGIFPNDPDYGHAFPLEDGGVGQIEFELWLANVTPDSHSYQLTYELVHDGEILDSQVESLSLAGHSWSGDSNKVSGQFDTSQIDSAGTYQLEFRLRQAGVLQDEKVVEFRVTTDPYIARTTSDECLVGTWRADNESFAGYLEDAFDTTAGGAGIDFEFGAGRGDIFLTFNEDGEMMMSGDGVELDVAVGDLASFTFEVQAEGRADYTSDGEAIGIWNADYASAAEGEGQAFGLPEVGSKAVVTMAPGDLFAYASSGPTQWTVTGAPDESSAAPYQCQGDELLLGVEDYKPVWWQRVE